MGSAKSKFTSDKKQLNFIHDIKANKEELKQILQDCLKYTKNLNDRMLLKYIAKEKNIVLGNYYIDEIFLYQFIQGRLNDDFDNLLEKYHHVTARPKTSSKKHEKRFPSVEISAENDQGEMVKHKFQLKDKTQLQTMSAKFKKPIKENYKKFLEEFNQVKREEGDTIDNDLKKLIDMVKKTNLELSIEAQMKQLQTQE